MTSVSTRHFNLVLVLSLSVHIWVLSLMGDDNGIDHEATQITQVTLSLVDFSSEVSEVIDASAAMEVEPLEVVQPEPLPVVEPDESQAIDAIDVIEVDAVEESTPIEVVASDAIDAVAVEVIEVALDPVVEATILEEVVLADVPPETDVVAVEAIPNVVESAALAPPQTKRAVRQRVDTTQRRHTAAPGAEQSTLADDLKNYAQSVHSILQTNKRYPDAARRAGEQGKVAVQFVLGKFGEILDFQIEASSGYPSLDREAVALLRRVKFPAIPVSLGENSVEFSVPLRFSLQ